MRARRREERKSQQTKEKVRNQIRNKIPNYVSVTGNVLRSADGRGCNLIVAKKKTRNGDPKKAARRRTLRASSISAGALSNTRSIGIETSTANPEAKSLDRMRFSCSEDQIGATGRTNPETVREKKTV